MLNQPVGAKWVGWTPPEIYSRIWREEQLELYFGPSEGFGISDWWGGGGVPLSTRAANFSHPNGHHFRWVFARTKVHKFAKIVQPE